MQRDSGLKNWQWLFGMIVTIGLSVGLTTFTSSRQMSYFMGRMDTAVIKLTQSDQEKEGRIKSIELNGSGPSMERVKAIEREVQSIQLREASLEVRIRDQELLSAKITPTLDNIASSISEVKQDVKILKSRAVMSSPSNTN